MTLLCSSCARALTHVSTEHPDNVIATVCDVANVARHDLLGPRRYREIVRARHVAMAIIRERTRLSLPEIGRLFGHRDHTTAMSGIRRVQASEDPHTRALLAAVRERLPSNQALVEVA